MRLEIKVIPKASRDRLVGWLGDRLKVAVTAPPERGKANAAVVALLSSVLGLPRSSIRIVAGETIPQKTVEIASPDESTLRSRLPAR